MLTVLDGVYMFSVNWVRAIIAALEFLVVRFLTMAGKTLVIQEAAVERNEHACLLS